MENGSTPPEESGGNQTGMGAFLTPQPPTRRWKTNRWVLLFILVVFLIAVITGIFYLKPPWLPSNLSSLGGEDDHILVGVPGQNGLNDLYLLHIGQKLEKGDLLLGKSVLMASTLWIDKDHEAVPITSLAYPYGGFIPGTPSLLYWYSMDGELYLDQLSIDDNTTSNLFIGNVPYFWGDLLSNPAGILLVASPTPDTVVCYKSMNGERARLLLKGDACAITTNSTSAYAHHIVDDEFTLKVANLANRQQYIPLEKRRDVGLFSVSADGSLVAYERTSQPASAILINSTNGEEIASSGPIYDILELNFAQNANLAYYIDENEAGDLELNLLDDQGTHLITTSQTLGAALSQDGKYLVYRVGQVEGEQSLIVRDTIIGKDIHLLDGDNLGYTIVDSLSRILISNSSAKLDFYTARVNGSNLIKLYGQEGANLKKVQYLPGEPYVFLFLGGENGVVSLYATHIDGSGGVMLADGWESVSLLDISPDGKQVLFTGKKASHETAALYLSDIRAGAAPLTLDDTASAISNAIFTPRGDQVIYTAIPEGGLDHALEAEVRKVAPLGNQPPETLYRPAFLISAQWDSLDAFQTRFMSGGIASSSICPGAKPFTIGETLRSALKLGQLDCYRFQGSAGQTVTFNALGENGLQFSLAVYDRKGNYIEAQISGQGNANNPQVLIFPADGLYFAQVSSVDASFGTYTLSATKGVDACAGAGEIFPGDLRNGKIPVSGSTSYRFSGKADQFYTFWLQDTSGEPGIIFSTNQGDPLENNLVQGMYSVKVPADGNYCLFISGTGVSEESYTIGMAEGKILCPQARELVPYQPVTGDLSIEQQNCFSFHAATGTLYSLAVTSLDEVDTMLELYGEQGNLLSSDDDSSGGYNPLLSYSFNQAGMYYAIVHGMYPEATGTYELTLIKGIGLCPDPRAIAAGDRVSASLQPGGEDCYSFSANTDEGVDFSLDAEFLTILTLYDLTGTEIARVGESGDNFTPHLATTIPGNGTYLLTIEAWDGVSSGDYNIEMKSSRANESCMQNSQPVAVGEVIEGTLLEGRQNCYALPAMSGQTVQIWVESQLDTEIVLYSPQGIELTRDDDSGGYTNPRLVATLPEDGVYLIAVEGFRSGSGTFTLHLETGMPAPNAFANALELAWQVPTRGAISSDTYLYLDEFKYDTHGLVYTFLGAAGDKVQVDVFAESLGSILDPVINLFDAEHSLLVTDDDSGTGYEAKIVYTLPYTGQYFIMVEDAHGRFGDPASYFFEILLSHK